MKLSGPIPVLSVNSVERSLAFYRESLQFVEVRSRRGENGIEWVYLGSGQSYIMLEQASDEVAPTDAVRLYFYIDDIASFYQFMRARGCAISEPETTSYGLIQCRFRDPDGYLVEVGQLMSRTKTG